MPICCKLTKIMYSNRSNMVPKTHAWVCSGMFIYDFVNCALNLLTPSSFWCNDACDKRMRHINKSFIMRKQTNTIIEPS